MRYPIVVAVAIGCVAASPHHIENRANNEASAFQITASSRDSGIDSLKIKASKNALHLGSPVQDACCNQLMAEDAATFYLKDTELFLYSPGNPKQQIYVDSDTDGTFQPWQVFDRLPTSSQVRALFATTSDRDRHRQ
ncbi:hypothetical protein ACLX1H_004534 [Fusarium chlamydosporum]